MSAGPFAQTQATLEAQAVAILQVLPQQLGITQLQSFKDSLAVGTDNSPTDRLAAARDQYQQTLARAQAGDLTAVNDFQRVASQYLTIGRDSYASGTGYQDIKTSVLQALDDVLGKETALQTDLLKEFPATIIEASHNQIGAIKNGTDAIVLAINNMRKDLARLGVGA